VRWKKVTLVGVGLLGGSLGLALKKRRLAEEVSGFVRRARSMSECKRLGAVDVAIRDLSEAVSGADLVILCTPLAQMRGLVQEFLPSLKQGAIVTDVGSVKGSVVRELEGIVAKAGGYFVGSHPMAGAEKMGVAAAREDLFEHAVCVVTPTRRSNKAAVRKVEQLWKLLGARVLRLSPEAHDDLVSRSSHLPHLIAATLANAVLDPTRPPQQKALCANGFRDTTRIASGSPEMWRDIVVANRRNVSGALGSLVKELQRLQGVIRRGDDVAISDFLEQAKARRDRWVAKNGSASPE
jgi:prephenate dehydrogenase